MVGDMAMLPELARTLWYVLWHRLHLFTVCIGLLSFSCSRGPDGNLTLLVRGSIAIALFFVISIGWQAYRKRLEHYFLEHLLSFLAISSLMMTVDASLDEMGRLMYFIIPICATAIALSGGLVRIVFVPIGRKDRPV